VFRNYGFTSRTVYVEKDTSRSRLSTENNSDLDSSNSLKCVNAKEESIASQNDLDFNQHYSDLNSVASLGSSIISPVCILESEYNDAVVGEAEPDLYMCISMESSQSSLISVSSSFAESLASGESSRKPTT